MAIQIGSTTIGAVPLVPTDPTVTGTGGTNATTQVTPQYQMNFTGVTRSSALGLAAPTSAGDLEILFAQLASALKEQLAALGDANAVAQSQARRGQLGNVMAAAQFMLGAGNALDYNRDEVVRQQKTVDAQTEVKNAAEATKLSLETQKGAKEQAVSTNETLIEGYTKTYNDLLAERSKLTTELAGLKQPKDATRISEINTRLGLIPGELSTAEGQIDTLKEQNVQLGKDIDALKTSITAQQTISDEAKAKIDAATRARDAAQAEVNRLTAMMKSFILDMLPMFLILAGKARSDMASDAGQVTVEGDSFEAILANAAQALVKLGEALASGRAGLEIIANTEGAGINQDQSVPDRFGQASAPVARAMAFAGLVAGTLSAVADLLRSLSAGLGMQTAGSFANEGSARMRVPV